MWSPKIYKHYLNFEGVKCANQLQFGEKSPILNSLIRRNFLYGNDNHFQLKSQQFL